MLGAAGIGIVRPAVVLDVLPGWTPEKLEAALTALELPKPGRQFGWIAREGKLLWIVNGLHFEPNLNQANEKHRKYVANAIKPFGDSPLVESFRAYYREWLLDGAPVGDACEWDSEGIREGIERDSKQNSNSNSNPNPNTNPTQVATAARARGENAVESSQRPSPREIAQLAAAANKGLFEHEDERRRQPIARIMGGSGSTLSAATKILGRVPFEFARAAVYELARTHQADRPISSLNYFVAGVLEAWEREQATEATHRSDRPAPVMRRSGRRNAGEEQFDNALAGIRDL